MINMQYTKFRKIVGCLYIIWGLLCTEVFPMQVYIDGSFNTLDTPGYAVFNPTLLLGLLTSSRGEAVKIDGSGNGVVVGYATVSGQQKFLVARYTPAGVLDTTFDSVGYVLTQHGSDMYDQARGLAFDASGKIVVVGGGAVTEGNDKIVVARYDTSGNLEASFYVEMPEATQASGVAIVVEGSGNYLIAGNAVVSGVPQIFVARCNTSGTRLNYVYTALPSATFTSANGAVLQSDGNFVVTGTTHVGDQYLVILRYNTTTFVLDTTFNTTGYVIEPLVTDTVADIGYGVVEQTDNKLAVGGSASNGVGSALFFRYTSSGALDTSTFNSPDGYLRYEGTTSLTNGYGLAIDGSGSLVLVGQDNQNGLLLRSTSTGAFDTTFGDEGVVKQIIGTSNLFGAVATDSNSHPLAVGVSDNKMMIARFLANNSPYISLISLADYGTITSNPFFVYGSSSQSGALVRATITPSGGSPIPLQGDITTGSAGDWFAGDLILPNSPSPDYYTAVISLYVGQILLASTTVHTYVNVPGDPAAIAISIPSNGQTIIVSNPLITGFSSRVGSSVEVKLDGNVIATVTTDAIGQWNAGDSWPMSDGTHTVDVSLDGGAATATSTFTINSQGGQGPRGITGHTGFSGATGFSGFTGMTGTSGSVGAGGALGLEGSVGMSGTTGISGVTGVSGVTGRSGVTGVSGATGLTGSSQQGIAGLTGLTGQSGLTGSSGVIGRSGSSGVTGVSGATGATGSSGVIGTNGLTGITGLQGVSGLTGRAGQDVSFGITGSSGVTGASGFTGTTGVIGRSGSTGLSGVTGPSGMTGASGQTGFTGRSGWSGTTGFSGITGFTGGTSTTGLSGGTGATGMSGMTGLTGITGVTGITPDGNIVRVDAVYGDDTSCERNLWAAPCLTLEKAFSIAQADDTVWVFPGIYTTTAPLSPASGVNIKGIQKENCILNADMTSVGYDTGLFNIYYQNSIENLTINVVSTSSTRNFGVILFYNDSAVRSYLQNVDIAVTLNAGSSATASVAGVVGYGNGQPASDWVNVRGCRIYVTYNGAASGWGILQDVSANYLRVSDSTVYATRASGTGTAYGVQTNYAGTLCDIRLSSIYGTSGAVRQAAGTIQLTGTELQSPTLVGLGLTDGLTPKTIVWGRSGTLATGTRYLFPSVIATDSASEVFVRFSQPVIVKAMSVRVTTAPSFGSVSFNLRKNGAAISPAVVVSLGTGVTTATLSGFSVYYAAGDTLSVQTIKSGSGCANTMVTIELY